MRANLHKYGAKAIRAGNRFSGNLLNRKVF
jgi:hypothetical protein